MRASATGSNSRVVPRLHVIAGDEVIRARDFRERMAAVVVAGGSALALQLRARTTSAARLFAVASWLVGVAREHGTRVVVNDRLDVALASDADGVHLREDSMAPAAARAVAAASSTPSSAARFLIGRSIHAPEQAATLRDGSVDYLILGSVYATGTHPGRRPIGPAAVADAVEKAKAPVLAIGGIEPGTVPAMVSLGVHGVVVLSGVWSAADPSEAVTRYLKTLRGER